MMKTTKERPRLHNFGTLNSCLLMGFDCHCREPHLATVMGDSKKEDVKLK